MVATIIDNERLKRIEQQPRGIFYAGSYITLLANNAAEFLENEVRADDVFTAQHAAFEFANQQRTRPGESSRRKCRSRSTVVSAPAILGRSEFKPPA